MSEQNCDTSRTPANKNPLLSASVTGLTFDDFTNKAIILPAAALPPKLPDPKETEPTKPVIFGTEPAILDTESFSEISLDQPSDQESYPSLANPLQDDQFGTDYSKPFNPLTQATQLTASLSQLPSVASSVFSSFSNILRGTSPTPNISTEQQQPQQHIDPYNAPPVPTLGNVPFVNSSLAYPSEEPAVPPVIPTFYSPTDPAFPPPAPTLSPPPANTSSGNAYRLTTKRKTYAPAPGLTYQDNQPVASAFPSYAPPLPNPINEPNFSANQSTSYENTAVNQPQPPSQTNKFSLTSFFSTPLLEKITGSGVSHNQETPASSVPDVYAVPSINPPAPATTINPGLFDTHPPAPVTTINPGLFDTHPPAPVTTINPGLFNTHPPVFNAHPPLSENIPTYSPQQQTYQPTPPLSTPLFFNPAQQTSLPAVNQTQSSAYGTPEPVSNISSIPPSSIPPSGNVSSYRLRGKPHYKNPLSSATTSAPIVTPFFQATPNPAITSEIFNPGNIAATETPDQSSQSSGFSHPPPSNVGFFNQLRSVPVEPKAPITSEILNPVNIAATETPDQASQPSGFSHPPPSNVGFFNQPRSVPVEPKAPITSEIFNPVNIAATETPDQASQSSGFSHPPPSNVGFFNQPPSVPVEPKAANVTFFNQPESLPVEPNVPLFNPFNPNSSGNTHSFDSFGTGNVQQPSILAQTQGIDVQQPVLSQQPFQIEQQQQFQHFQVPAEHQQSQSQPVQQHQPFLLQPFQQEPSQILTEQQVQTQSVETSPVQETNLENQTHSDLPLDQAHLTTSPQSLQTNLFQQFEAAKESDRLIPTQFQVPSEQSEIEQQVTSLQPQPFANPFAVPTPTPPSHSSDQQSNFPSDLFTPFQAQNQTPSFYPPQTASAESVDNQYLQEEVSTAGENTFQPQFTEEILDNTQAQFTDLNLKSQDIAAETNFFGPVESQQDDNKAEGLIHQTDTTSTDSKTSTTFDNFFGSQTTQQSAITAYPQQGQSEPIPTSTLASSFFTTQTNPSPADWFNSPKTVEPSTNRFEDDINRNPQQPTERETLDASSFFATNNNNQISSPPNYFQIQNFFNNPPLIADSKEQDSNFNFIENNLINKRLHNLTHHKGSTETDGGSISSNIVEPPSSAQSEFSEFAEVNPETSQSDEYLGEQQFPVDSPNIATMANTSDQSNGGPAAAELTNVVYRPVYKHWFFIKKTSDQKPTWTPFPMNDSLNLEEAFTSNSNQCITTNGGRYDVNIEERTRTPVYWNGASDEVRRCSWFYKGTDSRLVPYEENVADLLEEEYRLTSQSGEWNRKIVIPSGEIVMFQAPSIMVHFLAAQTPDLWPNASVPPTANRPRVVKRGVDEFNIEDGEPEQINHLLFMVHGIGAGCDLKFRSVEEVVEDFRSIAMQLTQSHYRSSCDRGEVGRIEVLPVSWHSELHSEESGIDEKLKAITLESIPKLRTFTNDTLLDILFYSSPVFCQKIMDTVAGTINRMYIKYCERNPNFKGNVSLAGHSLGSLILFDLLQNQRNSQCSDNQMDVDRLSPAECSDEGATGVRSHKPLSRTKSKKINYTIGPAGTGQPFINYPQLVFHPKKFFALGSPIGMFVTVRGIDNLGLDYKLPTTDGFYNIFHPYDPVAYRIEALVNSELIPVRPVLIPHHKGRKRMHLELRETMARVGADIKQKIVDTFKSVYNFASLQKPNDPKSLQQEVDKVLEQQLSLETSQVQRTRACSTSTTSSDDNGDVEFSLGMLNEGKRVDYVLQEAPLEFFNEYLFALTSHVCYWDSADTILFIVKEIYTSLGMQTDNQIPQQSMTIERPISTPSASPAPADS
ncbi:uncharacterized protein LOC119081136 isoform X2 [Bradysia coprophila]|uniref:uncharacterized protein LOC119081136 isoform X2 n=1 Tax=Bradysia coprophila TaxID=38358 RepID=UPI00187D99FA|nr:uncharacterized protein LOC119081136 isoform X2 [Bradysia coprophila]